MTRRLMGLRVWLLVGSTLAGGCGGGGGPGEESAGPTDSSTGGSGGTDGQMAAVDGSGGAGDGEGNVGLGGASSGGSSGTPERVWPGTIEEPLLASEVVDVLSVTDSKLILHVHRPEQRSRLFILNLSDYSHRWVPLEAAPDQHHRTYRRGIWGASSDNLDQFTSARLFSPDGELVWSWADATTGADRLLEDVQIVGDTALGRLEPVTPDGEAADELIVWTRDGQSASSETVALPGQWAAFTSRGTALSWAEGSLFETSAAGLVRTCPVDWEFGAWQSFLLDDVTLLANDAGVFAIGDDCDIRLIVPSPGTLIDTGSGVFAFYAGYADEPRMVELRAADGTLLGGVQMPDPASAPGERPFQPVQGALNASGRSWILGSIWGDVTNALSPIWLRLVSISSDGSIQTYQDLRGEPFLETSQVYAAAIAQDGDGVLIATRATNGIVGTATPGTLQISRWNSDLSLDPGRPSDDEPGSSGSSGGVSGGCADEYNETRLAQNVQMNSYCQSAYFYGCSGNSEGVRISCVSLDAFEAKGQCKYCN